MKGNNRINFSLGNNSAVNFRVIIDDLKEFAKMHDIPIIEAINYCIEDLEALKAEKYQVGKVDTIIMSGKNKQLISDCIIYLNKKKVGYEEKENQEKKKAEKQDMENKWNEIEAEVNKLSKNTGAETSTIGNSNRLERETRVIEKVISDINGENSRYGLKGKEKQYILKKLNGKLNGIRKMDEEQGNAQKAMDEIKAILDREDSKGNVRDRASYLRAMRKKVTTKKSNMSKESTKYLLELIDKSIGEEKDQIYYEQVRKFTNDFQFLSEYPELVNATSGHRKGKFTDRESYDRFFSLRESVQCGINEYSQINNLLNAPNLNSGDKRILEAEKVLWIKKWKRKEK